MKSFYFKDGIQIVIAILLTGSMAYAMQPTVIESPHSAPKIENVQSTVSKAKSVTRAPEKAAATPKKVTWHDNPQNCNEKKQYIAAESPFRCIDKSVAPSVADAAPVARHSYGGSSAKAFIYNHESGNNPGAIASNGACGLGQALPCSKLPCSLSNYACQDTWFTNYMLNRYGSWENARSFWISNATYSNGDYVGGWW